MTLPFLEKMLQVLAQGGFVATYKYAVLLALIDLCMESGHPPTSVTTVQLARRVVELYWPQVRAFPAKKGVLSQSSGGQAEIASLIAAFQAESPDRVARPRAGPHAPPGFERLLSEVEWVLIKMPLPRVQRIGSGEEQFLYRLGWDVGVAKSDFSRYKRGDGTAFDNRILFMPDAAESLVSLASVLRPLIQQQWMAKVRSLNQLDEAKLEEFMFGVERVALGPLQEPLQLLQGKRCFYCAESLGTGSSQVDHFLPWSRYPDNGLDNLVLAHDRCNRQKLHFLADLDFGQRWAERSHKLSQQLDDVALQARWTRDRTRTFGVVASVYQGVPDGVRLWAGGERLRPIRQQDLPAVHGFGKRLLAG